MAERIRNGRFTVANEQDVVLFTVGVRINKVLAVRRWLPVIRAIRPMLAELTADADSGLLAHRTYLCGPRELVIMQYWQSTKHLLDFSNSAIHRRAWRDFYQHATAGAGVGLWHETYVVPAGRYEAIYGIVPELGLAQFLDLKPIGRRNDGAAARLDAG
jgi:hypothetical protein